MARAQRFIRAGRYPIFDILSDPFQHRLVDGSGMVQGSPHGPGRLTLGARFTMGMSVGPVPYRSVNHVIEYDPPRCIAWATVAEFQGRVFAGGQTWRYELEPVDGGTLVTETYDWSGSRRAVWLLEKTGQPEKYAEAMSATLARLARLVEGH
ncbi:hypothetical protein KEM60_01505 [Austwickia sp. TVS 96-490-7B]|nr:hypothetical protein [Austwickia sp. TVS 96-490-7B]